MVLTRWAALSRAEAPAAMVITLMGMAGWVVLAVLCSYGGMYIKCCSCLICCSAAMGIVLGLVEAVAAVLLLASDWIGEMFEAIERAGPGSVPLFLLRIEQTPAAKVVAALVLIGLAFCELIFRPLASRAVATGTAAIAARPKRASLRPEEYSDWGVDGGKSRWSGRSAFEAVPSGKGEEAQAPLMAGKYYDRSQRRWEPVSSPLFMPLTCSMSLIGPLRYCTLEI